MKIWQYATLKLSIRRLAGFLQQNENKLSAGQTQYLREIITDLLKLEKELGQGTPRSRQ